MKWKVIYTAQARKDLRGIYAYIAGQLQARETAAGQTLRIMRAIRSLEELPMRHALYTEEPWRTQGLRFLPVDHYLVFYFPNETDKQVSIVRIMYGGRDVRNQLKQRPEDLEPNC